MFPALRPVRNAQIDREALVEVLEAAISFALDFDLYVPPYSVSKLVTVEQFNSRNELPSCIRASGSDTNSSAKTSDVRFPEEPVL